MADPSAASFTCPRCGATTHHPDDVQFGYCAACHGFTGVVLGSDHGGGVVSAAGHIREGRIRAMAAAGQPWAGLEHIAVTSGTAVDTSDDGTKTFRPFVTVEAKAEDGSVMAGQLSADEVRMLALNFLQVAAAADQDSLVFTVMTRDVGSPASAVAQFVLGLRKERERAV